MALHVGWENFWWLNVGLFALLVLLLVFFFPETKWHREPVNSHPEPPTISTGAKDNIEPESTKIENSAVEAEPVDENLHRGYPSKSQFRLWAVPDDPFKTLVYAFWIPWKMHLYPIIEFASFIVSWSASGFLTVNLTQSQAFAAPPYNWSSQSIGFTNFALFIGAIIGLFTNSALSDWISMRATRKNRGIREPEMRLPAMIPFVLIAILGNFVVAFGYEYHWDWRVCFLFCSSQQSLLCSCLMITRPSSLLDIPAPAYKSPPSQQ